ncbi:MAG: nucleic acid-binding protein [Armatimonadetes bacterium]|nr:nucleic acid-binding protein [Armatimonadota bacterium]
MPEFAVANLVAVFMDTNVLGMLTQKPGVRADSDACQAWGAAVNAQGVYVFVPEVADYELRREFLLTGNADAVTRLDAYTQREPNRYLPITTSAMREAARLRADLRKRGIPTAAKEALDGDALIAAQVFRWCEREQIPASFIAVATTNVSDLSRFTGKSGVALQAATWQNIVP